jgi:hypothetical protein
VIDVEDAFHGLRRFVPRLLRRPLLAVLPVTLVLRAVLLLGLRLRLRRGLAVLQRGLRRWLGLVAVHGSRLRGGDGFRGLRLVRAAFLARVIVLDVHDAALGIERRRLILALALAPSTAATAPVAPEPAPSSTPLTFLPLRQLAVAAAVHAWLRIAGVAGLRRIGGCLRGFRWCGGTLSFSIHLLSSVTSSAGG